MCGEIVTVTGGLYNIFSEKVKTRDLPKLLSKLLCCEVRESNGSPVLCKKCFRRIERYESTLEELSKLKESHRKYSEDWCAQNIRQKRCINSPGHGVKRISPLQFGQVNTPRRFAVRRSLIDDGTTSNLGDNENNVVLATTTTSDLEVRIFLLYMK